MTALTLSDAVARAVVRPEIGGGLACYELLDGTPLFRRAPDGTTAPFELAHNVLVPWSNRIGGGGFTFRGRFHAIPPNLPTEACPLHGNGFLLPWQVTRVTDTAVDLALATDGPGPFRYTARLAYALKNGSLAVALAVTNTAPEALPYGLGLHPWLPRTQATTLHAPATYVWLEDARHLPTARIPLAARTDWNFATPRALPPAWINNAFTGWSRRATVTWTDRGVALAIAASRRLATCIVFSPGADSDFFCFEPASHAVDAHNLPGGPEAHGLVVLAPGETLEAACRFTPRNLHLEANR